MSTLTLSITNLDQLQHGVTARHRFDCKGGTIGSEGANWLIFDRDQRVAAIHCEIRWIEGKFCVIDHCNRTYLNDDLHSLGQLAPRSLREGDQLRVGSYRLQVHHLQDQANHCTLEQLLKPEQRVLDAFIADAPAITWKTECPPIQPLVDICATFEAEMGRDPLAALDAAAQAEPSQANPLQRLIAGERP